MSDRKRETEKALRELLKLIADYPEVAERITITIKPGKLTQGDQNTDKQ